MKTSLKNAVCFAFVTVASSLGTVSVASAQQAPNQSAASQPVGVVRLDEFVYLVRVSNPGLQRGCLQLVRVADGAVLYQEVSTLPSFGQKLNVANLDDGQYAVVVSLGKSTHRYTLHLRTTTQRTTDLSLATTVQH